MTTYIFTPSPVSAFQFQPTLDNIAFNAIVTYNLYNGRYYLNLFYQNTLVYIFPLVGSVPNDVPVSLLPPFNPVSGNLWTSTLTYNSETSTFTVTP